MNKRTRRDFFKASGAAIASASLLSAVGCNAAKTQETPCCPGHPLKLGMASYTLRKFDRQEALEMTSRVGLKYIAFKSFHLPMDASDEECARAAEQAKQAGLELYGGGVIYMKNEAEVENAFRYAKAAGMSVIIGVPEHNLLDLVEEKVKETDIKLAIHNHGPGDERYPSPESAYELLKNRDGRMGLCMDIGHTKRIGLDPTEEFIKYKDRIFDVHVKDVNKAAAEGTTVEIGRGVIDIPKFIKALIEQKYNGIVSLEYEKDENDPLPGAAESIGYVRGVMAMCKATTCNK